MISRFLRVAGLLSLAALGLSCGRDTHTSEMIVEGFPIEEVLECNEGQRLAIPSIGIMEINIAGDLLVVSTSDMSNSWHTYSLPEIEMTGSLFNVGGGPGELMMPAPGIIASFYSRDSDGHTMCIIPSVMNGKFIAGDLTAHRATDTVINNRIGPTTVMSYRLNDSYWFNTEIVPDSCKIRRSIVSRDGKAVNNSAISVLNQTRADDISQMPLILFRPVIRPDGLLVAELPGFDPVIDVWNTETGESFRIRYPDLGNKQANARARMESNKPLFGGGVAFDDYFAIQRYDDAGNSHIDFFTWQGKPLASLTLECGDIRRFAIDVNNGGLYCLDADQDVIIRFQIDDFLSKVVK